MPGTEPGSTLSITALITRTESWRPIADGASAEDLELDLRASYIVSDRYQDVLMGLESGLCGILLLTGYGKGEQLYHSRAWSRPPDLIAEDLSVAVDWILAQTGCTT